MQTLDAVIKNGKLVTRGRVDATDDTPCLVTILDETLPAVRRAAKSKLAAKKQARLTLLLAENKRRPLDKNEEAELDALVTEVQQLAARRAEAAWTLQRLRRR